MRCSFSRAAQEPWTTLRAKYPQDFTVSPAQALPWHRLQAEACVKEQNTAAALYPDFAADADWTLTNPPM
jgi:hypothetical protein